MAFGSSGSSGAVVVSPMVFGSVLLGVLTSFSDELLSPSGVLDDSSGDDVVIVDSVVCVAVVSRSLVSEVTHEEKHKSIVKIKEIADIVFAEYLLFIPKSFAKNIKCFTALFCAVAFC